MSSREQYAPGALSLSPAGLSMPRSKGIVIGFWMVTALFCLQIGLTAYAQLRLPQVADAFTHLGFPAYFRVELAPEATVMIRPKLGHHRRPSRNASRRRASFLHRLS